MFDQKRMDAGFSVFNLHVNDAGKRADAEFISQFGQGRFDAEIAPLHEAGIMSIFDKDSNEYTKAWVVLVTAFVNGPSLPIASVLRIDDPSELSEFARQHGLRPDWHEPDEQDVSARVQGDHLDNAMGSCNDPDRAYGELNVVLTYDGTDVAVINLSTLLSWAARS